ncbi:hypothetical protein CPB85DRAFT_1445467 [Mucidula mucida]|nr:hypothetical protein CPB85DRAFT_1445467 [Mucidula mucida]
MNIFCGLSMIPALRRSLFPLKRAANLTSATRTLATKKKQRSNSLALSGSDWTAFHLRHFKFSFKKQTARKFFGVKKLLEPDVDPELLENLEAADMRQNSSVQLMTMMDLAMQPNAKETAVDDYCYKLLNMLEYPYYTRTLRRRKETSLLIAGESRYATADISLVDCADNMLILLVVEDKHLADEEPENVTAQLVAKAVAAFRESNMNRISAGSQPISNRVMPGIIMVGTSPTLYSIPLSETICNNIQNGTRPGKATIISFYRPSIRRPSRWWIVWKQGVDSSCAEVCRQVDRTYSRISKEAEVVQIVAHNNS